MKRIVMFIILFTNVFVINATKWNVGNTRQYTMPSQVSGLVQNGDTIEIDAGEYFQDVCAWTVDNLLINGINGMAHLKANNTACQGKAIWVIKGNNTRITNIEFSECSVIDKNGAGIRQEGKNLSISHCYFHDNENGILAGTVDGSKITIENTEFAYNGYGDGYSHNLYINNIDTLVFRFNYSHHAKIGHELKSRAKFNLICYNRFSNEQSGTASREIDLPNGGVALLIGNIVQQGVNTENSNMLAYGTEGLNNPAPHKLFLINNTFVNERWTGSFIDLNSQTELYKAYNNIFAGSGNIFNGNMPLALDTASNLRFIDFNNSGFNDAVNYDYSINADFIGVDKGTNPGNYGVFSLVPDFEYKHPCGFMPRTNFKAIDIGAYEFAVINVDNPKSKLPFVIYADQINNKLYIIGKSDYIQINDISGRLIYQNDITLNNREIFLNKGLFMINAGLNNNIIRQKIILY